MSILLLIIHVKIRNHRRNNYWCNEISIFQDLFALLLQSSGETITKETY